MLNFARAKPRQTNTKYWFREQNAGRALAQSLAMLGPDIHPCELCRGCLALPQCQTDTTMPLGWHLLAMMDLRLSGDHACGSEA